MSLHERADTLATGHAKSYLAVAIIFPILATIAVLGRFYCRRIKGVETGKEDWLILIALNFYYLQTAAEFCALFVAKTGSHIWTLEPHELALQYKLAAVLELGYTLVITFARCSLCVLFIRIFSARSFRIAAICNLAFNIAWAVYGIFITALRCSPAKGTFDMHVKADCINETAVFVSLVAWGIACDLITWALPIPTVWRLHLPLANRIALSLVFGLGLVVAAIGIVRIVTVITIDYKDFSYSSTTASNWAFAECGIAIIVVCGPMLRPLFDRLMPRRLLGLRSSAHTGTSGGTAERSEHFYGTSGASRYSRKAYNELHDPSQMELVAAGAGLGESNVVVGKALPPAPEPALGDLEKGMAEWKRGGGDEYSKWVRDNVEGAGIRVQRDITVTPGV